ncbi:MAG: tetratricopeptide repeat protein, partial [Planctomycetes bacterium]|nr:tetratricopeptide repeat protein [Planctomycetota bacterium]
METTIKCPNAGCGTRLRASEGMAGKRGRCPKCGWVFVIQGSALVPVSDSTGPPAETSFELVGLDAEDRVPSEWNVGDVILNLYEVKGVHTGGAMGLVYRVHHRAWNVDLAVKSPRRDYFKTEQQKENFVRECETWVNLGLHLNTVGCYYVRSLGGVPRVFAEYVEGGSLEDWIRSRRLYERGPEQAIEHILDVAIQFAWGLHFAHEQGLVHQDVKPANVLMTLAGSPKVTDFGLAKARVAAGETYVPGGGRSILISTGGMTPAYCSPEQANHEKLSRRTDIWSWAVSILEVFTGEVRWMAGQVADSGLQDYLKASRKDERIPLMPAELAKLLRRCLQQNPQDRPKDMLEVVAELQHVYRQSTGNSYPRQAPKPADLVADALNNQALSMLDLGNREQAEKLWQKALRLDPSHAQATYNRGLLLWRQGRLTDEALLRQLRDLRQTRARDSLAECLLAQVYIERGDAPSAVKTLEQAAQQTPGDSTVRATLQRAHTLHGNAARCVRTFGKRSGSIKSIALSADGRWALSGSEDYALLLWDVTTGECHRVFQGHTYIVYSVALSSDGRWAVSGSGDETLRLWKVNTGRCVRTFEGHAGLVRSVTLSVDNRWALSGSTDTTLRFWDIATGQCVRGFWGHAGYVNSVALSADG